MHCRPLFFLALLLLASCTAPPRPATSGVVATVHPLATAAGLDALRRGGSAVDAAVAAALTLGVVDGHNSGIGGGCFALVRRPDGTILAIDGRETAPRAAHRDMYVRDGKADPALSQIGALAAGVPGSLAVYDHLLRHGGGRLALADLLAPAADLAEGGFPLDATYAQRLDATAKDLGRFPESRVIFLDAEGNPHPKGFTLRQGDLARTYRAIAREGIGWFYAGPFAQSVERWMRANAGLLTAADFADYRIVPRQPLVTTYRGYTLVGFPPPSSGGLHVAQILSILEPFDLAALPAITRAHVTAEAMKLAFADRAHWLGDPAFAKVPRGLLSRDYARALSARIDPAKATPVEGPGQPPAADIDVFEGKHTTHIAAADADGTWVAITTTLNTSFGSKVVVPGTGVLLNNQMDDFSVQSGLPNAFGLIGADANAIAPGKRPLSSMSPTLVLDPSGRPRLTLGAAGGPTIISQVTQALIYTIDLHLPLGQALAAPRIHHHWRPDTLVVERSLGEGTIAALRAMGHKVEVRDKLGACQGAAITPSGTLVAIPDPRVPRE